MENKTERLAQRIFKHFAPPEDLTVSQWAEKHRRLSPETSAEAGPWRNRRTPYLVDVMDAFTDPSVKHITMVSSSQVGKSELELNIIGYIIDQDPGSVLYIHPTIEEAKKFSTTRIAPMIRSNRRLSSKVADIKSRDSKNTTLQKSFPGGFITMVGSQAAAGLAATPCRYVIGDERDRWALSAGTEGDPWDLAVARTTTYYNAKMVDVSTPTIKGASAIEKTYKDGTMEHWCHLCPDCGEYSELKFDDIKFDFDVIDVADRTKDYVITRVEWCCPKCGVLHKEDQMRRQPAMWIAENPRAIEHGHRSFKLSAFASPWVPWQSICYKFLKSKNDPRSLQVFYNTVRGDWFEARGDIIDEDEALKRREDYGMCPDGLPADAPNDVLLLTMGVDVQDDRLEYEVVGHGRYRETWGVKYGVIMGDANMPEVWQQLDDVLEHEYRRADGKPLRIAMTFVDSGGHKTQSVYIQTRQRMARRVFAIKGQGGEGVPYTKPPTKVKIVLRGKIVGQAWLYTIGVDAGKADVFDSFRVMQPGPKYCHFPIAERAGYSMRFFEGLLSERPVMRTTNGRTRWMWEKINPSARNEPLDCRNYALAAFRALDPDMEAIAARMREADGEAPQQKAAAQPVPRKARSIKSRAFSADNEW